MKILGMTKRTIRCTSGWTAHGARGISGTRGVAGQTHRRPAAVVSRRGLGDGGAPAAWLYRTELLRKWGKLTEALAWVCLEVELNPDNVAAVALKERLNGRPVSIGGRAAGKASLPERRTTRRLGRVAGMWRLKAMLERDVILPLQEPQIYEHYRLNLPNGILLRPARLRQNLHRTEAGGSCRVFLHRGSSPATWRAFMCMARRVKLPNSSRKPASKSRA